MTGLRGLIAGCWGLLRVLSATGFRRNGRYWRWRDETAFGRGRPTAGPLRRAALDYGAWTVAMRRLGRSRVRPSSPPGGPARSHR